MTDPEAVAAIALAAGLTPAESEVLLLSEGDGLSDAEIAGRRGVTLSCVKSLRSRAARKIREETRRRELRLALAAEVRELVGRSEG
ncbi:MAG TPA: sigma factor-like helix-turn-helix DNA-binding protein [Armatimonadota bacterium]|nr:sigma factor-like helix-turn-helix DNA-binding protein [Armatimonadota bacterium]